MNITKHSSPVADLSNTSAPKEGRALISSHSFMPKLSGKISSALVLAAMTFGCAPTFSPAGGSNTNSGNGNGGAKIDKVPVPTEVEGQNNSNSNTTTDSSPQWPVSQGAVDDPLTPEQLEILDNAPLVVIDKWTLPDGRTYEEAIRDFEELKKKYEERKKNRENDKHALHSKSMTVFDREYLESSRDAIVFRMFDKGEKLTRAFFDVKPAEGPNAPAQTRLVYGYGLKDPTVRAVPNPLYACCTESIYGLDCSGLVTLAANSAGIAVDGLNCNVKCLKNTATWNDKIVDGLKMVDVPLSVLSKTVGLTQSPNADED